jgi:hypothetical protein
MNEAFFRVGRQRPENRAISSFRLALNDFTFSLNSLLKLDPQFLEQVGYRGCKDAITIS